jgi:hypothetical protein
VKLCIRRYPLVRCTVNVLEGILFCWASVVFGYETCGRVANSCVDVSFVLHIGDILDTFMYQYIVKVSNSCYLILLSKLFFKSVF